MQELPQDLLGPIQKFEKEFTVDKERLKKIVNHFVKELEKGMFIPSSPISRVSRTNQQDRFDR
jgi:hexokinase